jgi:flagellar basal-body rod protein FlgG
MSGSIYTAGSGAILQQMRLDVYANNLANVNTVGFKADQPVFRMENADQPPEPGERAPVLSPYALPMRCVTDFDSGALQSTGGQLDVSIVGNGFFEVQTPDGPQYTRNGRFSINEDGVLSTQSGWPVMGQGGEIAIEGNRIVIGEGGEVSVDGKVIGVLKVADFKAPELLTKTEGTLFKADNPAAGIGDAQDYRLAQGTLEASNVNAIRTMTEMIETLRVFETYQKVIHAADDATSKTVNEVGRSV